MAIAFYKSFMNINPEFIWKLIQYILRKGDIAYLPLVRSSCYRVNYPAFCVNLQPKNLPSDIKQSNNLEEFKLKLRN